MIIPTCFEDLDWGENAKPTSAHFLSIVMALRERFAFAESSSLPIVEDWGELGSNNDYNAISLTEIQYWIDAINYGLAWVGEIAEQAITKSSYNLTESIAVINKPIVWMPTDTELPVESEHSQKLNSPKKWLLAQEEILALNVDNTLIVHKYKEIDFRAVMKILNQYKNAIGGLTEIYAPLDTLAFYRPQYYIDWRRARAGDARPSFTAIQERRDEAEGTYIGAFWSQSISDPAEAGDWEWLEFMCNDCDIPYIFNLPAVVSVHCWEERKTNDEYDDSWFYDFGTGLSLGWNNLGTHNLGERIPLLPKQGWGDAKATAVPPKRGSTGYFHCEWGIDLVKFDFRDSLKFKVLPADA